MSSLLYFLSILVILNTNYFKATSKNPRKINWTINENNVSHKLYLPPIWFESSSNLLKERRTLPRPTLLPPTLSKNAINGTHIINVPLQQNCFICSKKFNDSNDVSMCQQGCAAIYHSRCLRIWKRQIRQKHATQWRTNPNRCPNCSDKKDFIPSKERTPKHRSSVYWGGFHDCMVGFILIFVFCLVIGIVFFR